MLKVSNGILIRPPYSKSIKPNERFKILVFDEIDNQKPLTYQQNACRTFIMLTIKQKKLLDYIKSYYQDKDLFPTFEEMKDNLRIKSKSGI